MKMCKKAFVMSNTVVSDCKGVIPLKKLGERIDNVHQIFEIVWFVVEIVCLIYSTFR